MSERSRGRSCALLCSFVARKCGKLQLHSTVGEERVQPFYGMGLHLVMTTARRSGRRAPASMWRGHQVGHQAVEAFDLPAGVHPNGRPGGPRAFSGLRTVPKSCAELAAGTRRTAATPPSGIALPRCGNRENGQDGGGTARRARHSSDTCCREALATAHAEPASSESTIARPSAGARTSSAIPRLSTVTAKKLQHPCSANTRSASWSNGCRNPTAGECPRRSPSGRRHGSPDPATPAVAQEAGRRRGLRQGDPLRSLQRGCRPRVGGRPSNALPFPNRSRCWGDDQPRWSSR